MGCINSNALRNAFEDLQLTKLSSVLQDDLLNQRVHVAGVVQHLGTAIAVPFVDAHAAIARIDAFKPTALRSASDKKVFSASKAIDFAVSDGIHSVRVNMAELDNWTLELAYKKVLNILRDDELGCLVSGGDAPGLYSQCEPKPGALEFWSAYNQGIDPPQNITGTQDGMAAQGNRPRMARVFSLKIGEPVAIVGVVREAAGSRVLVPLQIGQCGITNKQETSRNLSKISQIEPDVQPNLVQMLP